MAVSIGVTVKDAANAAEQAVFYGITKPMTKDMLEKEYKTMTIDEMYTWE